MLDNPGHGLWAFEIKLSLSPRPRRGFHHACDDLKPDQRMVVYPGQEDYALSETIEAVGFASAVNQLRNLD